MRRALLVVVVAVLSVGALGAPADAATNSAVVVIDTGNGTRRATITFSESSITGLEALERAGANPVVRGYGGLGGAVCMIDGVGHPADPCFGPRDFWAYYRAPGGAPSWTFSPIGAGATQVRNGDVEGWRWGTGSAPGEPPLLTPSQPPPPGGGGGGSGGAGGGSGAPGSPDDRSGSTPNRPGSDGATSTSPSGAPTDTKPPVVEAERERDRDQDDDEPDAQAAGLTGAGDGDAGSGSGSPVGLLVAAAILVALVATAVIVQRRRRALGADVPT